MTQFIKAEYGENTKLLNLAQIVSIVVADDFYTEPSCRVVANMIIGSEILFGGTKAECEAYIEKIFGVR